ncbi:hypothetical protein CDV36_016259 [Fusarium kuroshium]|uniref:Heterokaryon incompatibility domain-containing protein n=1 Tax=Fusarium kuroshium TaxID=2010991 RepID=A0A3M2QW00_9HYPO|nr:hypothetical protein CDV36_016259 [Fusarium kuroshium]
MDKIYSEAYFTIIAAAGEDSSNGLAGVTIPREQQERAQINGTQFSYLCTPPREKIRSTTWAERGWTYQEGFLSRRRIFFTNEQVIFQCNNMTCLETFSIPMKALHTPDGTRARRLPVLVDIEPLDIRRQDIGGHIMEYSKRQLSHESDSLNAFMGILSFFKTKHSWCHFQGNPIHPEKRHLINAWYHPMPATRRPEFPSWSWTGWEGGLKLTSRDNPDYTVQLRTKTGELISVNEYIKLCGEPQQPDMEPVIELTGKMMDVSFQSIDWASDAEDLHREGHDILSLENGMWAALPFTSDVLTYSFFYLDDKSLEEKTEFTLPAMVLETGIRSQKKNSVVLVLREKNGYYERAGLLKMVNASNPAAENKIRTVDVQPAMYKDAYGCWSTRAPTCELERRVWLEAAKEKTIQLG